MISGDGGRQHGRETKLEVDKTRQANRRNPKAKVLMAVGGGTTGSGVIDGFDIFDFYRQVQQHRRG